MNIAFFVAKHSEPARRAIQEIEAAPVCAEPQSVSLVDQEARHIVVAEAVWDVWIGQETLEGSGLAVEPIQALLGADPKIPRFVLCNAVDTVVAQRGWVT